MEVVSSSPLAGIVRLSAFFSVLLLAVSCVSDNTADARENLGARAADVAESGDFWEGVAMTAAVGDLDHGAIQRRMSQIPLAHIFMGGAWRPLAQRPNMVEGLKAIAMRRASGMTLANTELSYVGENSVPTSFPPGVKVRFPDGGVWDPTVK